MRSKTRGPQFDSLQKAGFIFFLAREITFLPLNVLHMTCACIFYSLFSAEVRRGVVLQLQKGRPQAGGKGNLGTAVDGE